MATIQEKRDKIIQIAKAEIGVKESPPNSNKVKYNDWFYNKTNYSKLAAWCGTFVSWVYHHAGLPLGTIDYTRGFAGCPYALNNVDKWGVIVEKPEKGDVVFFDWNLDKKQDHTGIFECDNGNGKTFSSIEGNTSVANNSDGGSVMPRNNRPYSMAIFVRPNVLINNL